MNVYCKFANIGRNIFLNRIGVYRNLRIFDEIFFRIAKLVFLFQSGCIPRSAWNIGIIFFFFADWYTVEYMKAKLAKNFCNFKNSKRFLRLFVEFDRFSSCSSKSINLEYWNYFSLSPIARKCTTKDS